MLRVTLARSECVCVCECFAYLYLLLSDYLKISAVENKRKVTKETCCLQPHIVAFKMFSTFVAEYLSLSPRMTVCVFDCV